MKVYLVLGWVNGDSGVYGVYSSPEKADERVEALEGNPYENYKVKPVQLDKDCEL